MKKYIPLILLPSLLFLACKKEPSKPADTGAEPVAAASAATEIPGVSALPAEGDRVELPGGCWFTWKFSEKPKLGTLIVKVQVFNKDGSRNTSYGIAGETGMPEMRAHDAAAKFVMNKKGDYLMPFDVAMPGEWRVVIRVTLDGKEIYAGRVLFSI